MAIRCLRRGQNPPSEAKSRFQREKAQKPLSYLVLGVEDDGLGVRHAHDVVVEAGGGEPGARRQLVVEQRQLRDEPLRLLLFGGQGGQALPDGDQGLDELPLGSESDGLGGVGGGQLER